MQEFNDLAGDLAVDVSSCDLESWTSDVIEHARRNFFQVNMTGQCCNDELNGGYPGIAHPCLICTCSSFSLSVSMDIIHFLIVNRWYNLSL